MMCGQLLDRFCFFARNQSVSLIGNMSVSLALVPIGVSIACGVHFFLMNEKYRCTFQLKEWSDEHTILLHNTGADKEKL